jgi:plasmid stabilization system protein ParE
VAGYRLVPAVEADIEQALRFTRETFGEAKYIDYATLIEEALDELAADPRCGKLRPYIHPDACIYEIARPGRNARHLFLYEVVDNRAHVYGLFYDGMDLPALWRVRQGLKLSDE